MIQGSSFRVCDSSPQALSMILSMMVLPLSFLEENSFA